MATQPGRIARIVLVTAASVTVGLGASAPATGVVGDGPFRTRFTLFQHDLARVGIDHGDPGPGVGDMVVIGGEVFDRQGGTRVGRSAAQCATTGATDLLCTAAFTVGDGQITFQGLVDVPTFFTGHPTDFAVTGGTGPYHKARGTVTITILPGGTDAQITVDLS